ncbi:GNAT family N-acetyltransferase [Ureibacillus manganicus]|uniref:GNAT family acetyltransferase n=1 Tax=Ureibacillus manganicus DSM 26584 TaxID=1384049 RepID=A0A0A3I3T5_9BACL|nr:GNAT family N-acetyltransferase [Ureibacillus manganicus]KGR79374.1 GNAT family acetyltransferase [Ureibacillus manganicus DSM 26584]
MNFSIIKASFPIDTETFDEIKTLCVEAGNVDRVSYCSLLNLRESKELYSKGFFVLAYDDELNQLVGVASAIDIMGLETYDWSMVVSPMYRQIGIGTALFKVLHEGLFERGAEGELALVHENSTFGKRFLERFGFIYSFSEATFEAKAQVANPDSPIYIRQYSKLDQNALVQIFSEAFGDLREESLELIDYNTTTEGSILWVAELNGDVVGTLTTSKEGDVQKVTAFAVHPEVQGKGIGTALLDWSRDFALRNGEKYVMLDVEIENERALSVYEKAGFQKCMQVDYYVYSSGRD